VPKSLPPTDHRAIRKHLVNDDFALSEGSEFVPAGNIDPDVWSGIMGLPDDVAIRTTDLRTEEIEHAHAIAVSWLDVHYTLPEGPLQTQVYSVFEAFHASLFNAVTGWYRTAGLALRAGVDDLLLGLHFQIKKPHVSKFYGIITGAESSPKFGDMRAALHKATKDPIFSYPGGQFGAIYDTLSIYTHRISNAEIWRSNGPIYVPEGFNRWFSEYTTTDRTLRGAIDVVRPLLISTT
jgi:hypothetical protein